MKKILFLIITGIGMSVATYAQSTGELLKFSRQDFSLSTARSAAMGGAFTSLGADVISMSLNPAGLAMYSSSELSISAGIRLDATRFRFGSDPSIMKTFVKPYVGNFGILFKSDDWTFGVGMNRLADFAGGYNVAGAYGEQSMAYIFRDQLVGIEQGSLNGNRAFDRNPILWNAVMANEAWLVNPTRNTPSNKEYDLYGVLERGDIVASTLNMRTDGANDEIAFSTAYNYNGVFMFGATLGVQSIRYLQSSTYSEFADLQHNYGSLDSFEINENLNMNGVGVNLKVGVTVRPISWLRVGVAYHSPTWITMHEESNRDMNVWLNTTPSHFGYSYTPDLVQEYQYRTPSRLMAGISFTIARRIIISGDYERTWYGDMKFNTPMKLYGYRAPVAPDDIDNLPIISGNYVSQRGEILYNQMIKDAYRATNNYRVGIEVQPVDGFFLRAGYAYSESPYKALDSHYKAGATLNQYGAIKRYSGGLGFRSGKFNIDLAYVYSTQNALPSVFYDYVANHNYEGIKAGDEILPADNIYRTMYDHNIILTMGLRF